MQYINEENRWQRDDHHHKDDKKMKATISRARCRHSKEQQGEIDDKPVAERSYCGHAGNASQHLMYMNICVKDAVARRLLVDGAFENLKSWLLPDQKRGGRIDTM